MLDQVNGWGVYDLAPTRVGLWGASGPPGVGGTLFYWTVGPLALESSGPIGEARSVPGATGPALPGAEQFPSLDATGGTVWVWRPPEGRGGPSG